MERMRKRYGLRLVILILCAAGTAGAADWPQWRGAGRDGHVQGFAVPATWPQQLTQVWRTPVGASDATPALVGDRLYVFARQGDEQIARCLDAATGRELWHDTTPAPEVKGGARRHPGPRSSPTVVQGKVLFLGVGGVLSCLDAGTGKVLWRKDPFPGQVPQFYTASSPLVAEGRVIAHLGGQEKGGLLAYDLNTGAELWRWAEDGPAYGSSVLATLAGAAQIVTLTDKGLVGIGLAGGKLLWRYPFAPGRRSTNSTTPIVDGDTVIVSGQGRGTKALRIVRSGTGLAAQEVWSSELSAGFATPVLEAGHLYGLAEGGTLFCLDAATGKTAWTDDKKYDRFGSLVAAEGTILVLSPKSELVAFQADPSAYRERARIKVAETPVYAHPVLSGRRIFVKDQDSVILWTLEG